LERVLTLPASPFASFLRKIAGVEAYASGEAKEVSGLRVLDDRRLEIHLSEPDATLPMVLAMKFATPLRRDHVARVGNDIRRMPLGTGPFMLTEWQEGSKLVFARNPHYWEESRPYLDGLIMHSNVPLEMAFLRFEAGQLDMVTPLSAADYLWLAERPDWRPYIDVPDSLSTIGVRMNCQRPPFDDVRVRQALNYGVNKDNIRKILNGTVTSAHGILPDSLPGHNPRIEPYPYDPERARALLAEAGYPDGLTIDYVTIPAFPHQRNAQAMQADLRRIGVDMRIELVSPGALFGAIGERDFAPFSFVGWQVDYPDPSSFIDVNFHSRMIGDSQSNNNTFYANPQLDRLIDAAKNERDPRKRRGMYEEIDAILHRDAPWIWLYHFVFVSARQPYLAGFKPHPMWRHDYREAWLDLPADHPRRAR
ncbi:MAG: ABC transporter substrate-binding protein, partial [Myxococcota bacterium]